MNKVFQISFFVFSFWHLPETLCFQRCCVFNCNRLFHGYNGLFRQMRQIVPSRCNILFLCYNRLFR